MSILSVGSGLDSLWERVKVRFGFQDFDTFREQSFTHHTLNTGLIFGTIGCLFAMLPQTTYANGFAAGVMGGLVGYVIREELWLGRPNQVQWWDGVMDFVVPIGRLAPIAVAIVVFQLPWWVALAVQVSLACEALGYTVFRPKGSLYY